MMESMRYSVAADNIKVCLVNPGPVATNFFEQFKGKETKSEPGAEGATLAHRMTAASIKRFEQMSDRAQTAASCGKVVADIVVREAAKAVSGHDHGGVTFWNGSTDYASQLIQSVKCHPDGHSGPIYEQAWQTASDLAKAATAGDLS
jgi:NAD(P)-dependent dehydrogenase (short-subunit alcohol dehydrogenase family)